MRLLLVLLVLLCTASRAVHFKDCGSTAGVFDKVEISNCDVNEAFCVLTKGTNATMDLLFTPTKQCDRVMSVIHGIIDDMEVPFPFPNHEACVDNNSRVTCPLAAGTRSSYHTTLPVLTKYPTIRLITRWELKDENGDNIVCIQFPVSIQ